MFKKGFLESLLRLKFINLKRHCELLRGIWASARSSPENLKPIFDLGDHFAKHKNLTLVLVMTGKIIRWLLIHRVMNPRFLSNGVKRFHQQ